MDFYPYFSEDWENDRNPDLSDLDVYDLEYYPHFPEWDSDPNPELDDWYAYDDYV